MEQPEARRQGGQGRLRGAAVGSGSGKPGIGCRAGHLALETQSRGAEVRAGRAGLQPPGDRGPSGTPQAQARSPSFLGASPDARWAGRSETWRGVGWRLGDRMPCRGGELVGAPARQGWVKEQRWRWAESTVGISFISSEANVGSR